MNGANTKRQILVINSPETRRSNHPLEIGLFWEFSDAFDEILVRFPL